MIKRVLSFRLDEFYQNIVTLASGTVISQIIPFLASLVLARLFTPQDFGKFGLFLSFLTIGATIVTGKFDQAIVLPSEKQKGFTVFALSMISTLLLSSFTFLLLLIFKPLLTDLIDASVLKIWYLLPIGLFLIGVNQSFLMLRNREKKYKNISYSKIFKSLLVSVIGISLGLVIKDYNVLIVSHLLGFVISIMILRDAKNIWYHEGIKKLDYDQLKSTFLYYIDFPKKNILSALLNTTSNQLPIIMLTSLFSVQTAGAYLMAQRILFAPMSFLGSSIGQVFFQRIAENKNDENLVKEISKSLYIKLLIIAVPTMSIIFFWSSEIFNIILGSKWENAAVYAKLLSPWGLVVFISSPLSTITIIQSKHNQNVIFNIILLIGRVSALLLGFYLFNDDYYSILCFGIIGFISWLGFNIYLLKLLHFQISESILLTLKYSIILFSPFLLIYLLIQYV